MKLTYEFGPDAFRDIESERFKTYEVLERMNAGDEVGDLSISELERVVDSAKAEGTNIATLLYAAKAEDQLDNEYERAYERAQSAEYCRYEDSLNYRQSMTDAGRGHLLS